MAIGVAMPTMSRWRLTSATMSCGATRIQGLLRACWTAPHLATVGFAARPALLHIITQFEAQCGRNDAKCTGNTKSHHKYNSKSHSDGLQRRLQECTQGFKPQWAGSPQTSLPMPWAGCPAEEKRGGARPLGLLIRKELWWKKQWRSAAVAGRIADWARGWWPPSVYLTRAF